MTSKQKRKQGEARRWGRVMDGVLVKYGGVILFKEQLDELLMLAGRLKVVPGFESASKRIVDMIDTAKEVHRKGAE